MKQDIELMIELLKRQLGYEPTQEEINNMKDLLSVQVGSAKKTRMALQALDDVYKNENCSWYQGIYSRNKDCLKNTGVFYRGNKLTKEYIYKRGCSIATALYANGITKGKKFAICTSNIPDLITTLWATSFVGGVVNIFDSSFAPEYIKRIIDSCDAEFIIVSDDKYGDIASLLGDTKIKKKVLLSLADHLPEEFPQEYIDMDIPKELYDFPNRAIDYKKNDDEIVLIDEFIEEGSEYCFEEVRDKNPSIYDDFTITYSSGSSRPDFPKAIPHRVFGYLTMMRFHDSDMSGLPDLSNIVGLAHIPPISDTNIKSVISDTMGQKSIVACEPIYGTKTFIYSLLMNRPNFCDATRSSWVQFAKDVLFDSKFLDADFSYLGLPLAVGEPLEMNERMFVDKAFAKTRAGNVILKKLGLPLPHTYLGEGGGRTESGGVVYTVFQSLFENLNKLRLKKGKYGMAPCTFVDTAIIDENGEECGVNEIGELCADSVCTMTDGKYFFPEDNNDNFYLTDKYGRVWPRFGVYAYRNEVGNIIMKGRMGSEFLVNGQKIPEFVVSDIILKDKKRILSCEVVNLDNIPVVNLELNPFAIQKEEMRLLVNETLTAIEKRCHQLLPNEIADDMVYRLKSYDNSFDLTGCAKRDVSSLVKEGLQDCVKPILVHDAFCLMNATDYFKMKNDNRQYTLIRKKSIVDTVKGKIRKRVKNK